MVHNNIVQHQFAHLRWCKSVPGTLAFILLAVPVLAGFAGTLFPAFGYLPILGYEHFSLFPITQLLNSPGIFQSALLSFGTGLTASLVSLFIVLLFTAGWFGTRTFQKVSLFLSPLLSVPHAAAAIGLAFLIAPSGFVVRLFSPWATGWTRPPDFLIINDPLGIAMTLGLVAKEVPFLLLMTIAALSQPSLQKQFKAGTSLGYGHVATFSKVILPQIYPLLRLPMLAVIAYSTSVVDVAEILGPTSPAPLAPRLVLWMNDPDLSKRLVASAGALLQLLITLSVILTYLTLERCGLSLSGAWRSSGNRYVGDRSPRLSGLLLITTIVGSMMLALCLLTVWSVTKSWWFPSPVPQAWDFWKFYEVSGTSFPTIATTLLLAFFSAALATLLSLWLLEENWTKNKQLPSSFRGFVFLPLLVPQITFLFGMQLLFLLFGSNGSFIAVLLAHLLFTFPYAFLSLCDPFTRLDQRYIKAATSLGASQIRCFWHIRLPLLLRPVLTAFAVAAAVSVGQHLPTILIGAGRVVTVTTESVALASGGSRQAAAIFALLQLIIPMLFFTVAILLPLFFHRDHKAMRLEKI